MQKCPGVVVDSKGAPLAGVSVQVNLTGGGAAAIFSDNGTTSKSNPFTNESNGSFEFYAADGRYNLVFTKAGMTIPSLLDYALSDPAQTSVSVLNRDTSLQDVVNTTTPTTVYSYSLAGGTLLGTNAIRMTAVLDLLNNTGSTQALPTITAQYGGSTAATFPTGSAILAAGATRWGLVWELMLCAAGLSSTQYAWGTLRVGNAAGVSGTLVPTTSANALGVHTGLAINSSVAQTVTLIITNPVQHASYSTRCLAVQLEHV